MQITPILGLKTYDLTTDASVLFSAFRLAIAGVTDSNFTKIDTAIGTLNTNVSNLLNKPSIVRVQAVKATDDYTYTATGTGMTQYTTGAYINLSLDTTNIGTATLNIDGLGAKSLLKIDSTGIATNLSAKDIRVNKCNLFMYTGTSWIWVSTVSSDQMNVVGTVGNFTNISSENTLQDSGYKVNNSGQTANDLWTGDKLKDVVFGGDEEVGVPLLQDSDLLDGHDSTYFATKTGLDTTNANVTTLTSDKISRTEIVNNLTNTVIGSPLDSTQGTNLQNQITVVKSSLDAHSLKIYGINPPQTQADLDAILNNVSQYPINSKYRFQLSINVTGLSLGSGGSWFIEGNKVDSLYGWQKATIYSTVTNGSIYKERAMFNGVWSDWKTYMKSDMVSNPNLLINGDFQVWQRGTSFTNVANYQYTVDRWRLDQSGATVNISKETTGEVKLQYTVKGTYAVLIQIFEKNQNIIGKTVTFSAYIKTDSGATFGVAKHAITQNSITGTGNWQLITFNTTFDDSTMPSFGISLTSIQTMYIKWMKLELGSIATPFVPRGYGEELMLCQRYYQRGFQYQTFSTPATTTKLYFSIPISPMRITPTIRQVSGISFTNILDSPDIGFNTPTSATQVGLSNKAVQISFVGTFAMNQQYRIDYDYFEADAEL